MHVDALADLSGFLQHDALRTAPRDSVETALTVYRTPSDGRYRRVDLICAIPETYWTTVVGWTGGTMFQRDLRLAAKSVYGRFFTYLNPRQTQADFLFLTQRTKV